MILKEGCTRIVMKTWDTFYYFIHFVKNLRDWVTFSEYDIIQEKFGKNVAWKIQIMALYFYNLTALHTIYSMSHQWNVSIIRIIADTGHFGVFQITDHPTLYFSIWVLNSFCQNSMTPTQCVLFPLNLQGETPFCSKTKCMWLHHRINSKDSIYVFQLAGFCWTGSKCLEEHATFCDFTKFVKIRLKF